MHVNEEANDSDMDEKDDVILRKKKKVQALVLDSSDEESDEQADADDPLEFTPLGGKSKFKLGKPKKLVPAQKLEIWKKEEAQSVDYPSLELDDMDLSLLTPQPSKKPKPSTKALIDGIDDLDLELSSDEYDSTNAGTTQNV